MMSNRIVEHSSRYTGPAGDSRPAKEIFAGMEARSREAEVALSGFHGYLDKIMSDMPLSSHPCRVEAIKDAFISWWMKHDLGVKSKMEG